MTTNTYERTKPNKKNAAWSAWELIKTTKCITTYYHPILGAEIYTQSKYFENFKAYKNYKNGFDLNNS